MPWRLQLVQSLDVFTINEESNCGENSLEFIWKAFSYFPNGLWHGINYLGNMNLKHDLGIKSEGKIYEAFIFSSLMIRIRREKDKLKNQGLLLAVTCDPVIAVYRRLESGMFEEVINLIRDYVSNEVGVISLFKIEERTAPKIAAHGLGHNKGLSHHAEPVDLMYARLLDGHPIQKDGFCNKCRRKLKREM
jgi:hypothetical protein